MPPDTPVPQWIAHAAAECAQTKSDWIRFREVIARHWATVQASPASPTEYAVGSGGRVTQHTPAPEAVATAAPAEAEPPKPDELRERLGRRVREVWIKWAEKQPTPKHSWLLPWDKLTEPEREVDRCIGAAIWGDCIAEHAELLARAKWLGTRYVAVLETVRLQWDWIEKLEAEREALQRHLDDKLIADGPDARLEPKGGA